MRFARSGVATDRRQREATRRAPPGSKHGEGKKACVKASLHPRGSAKSNQLGHEQCVGKGGSSETTRGGSLRGVVGGQRARTKSDLSKPSVWRARRWSFGCLHRHCGRSHGQLL